MTARELTELVLKFEDLKTSHNLNYAITTEVTSNGEYVQNYTIQSLTQFGELLNMMCNHSWEVKIIHITSHIGKGGE